MTLIIGCSTDPVVIRCIAMLVDRGVPFGWVDLREAACYRIVKAIETGVTGWSVERDGQSNRRPVHSIFYRPASTLGNDSQKRRATSALTRSIQAMLLSARCRIVNEPSCATSNFSKPYQLGLMARAGFRVPRTLVTNDPAAARTFIVEQGADVLFKGVSSVKTTPQRLRFEHMDRLSSLRRCPAQFQEFVAGDDFRVTVIDTFADVACVPEGQNEVFRAAPDALPDTFIAQCVRFTRDQGLVVGGIDLRKRADGTLVVFELNPYPLLTHYESATSPRLTERVIDFLVTTRAMAPNVFA